MSSEDEKSTRRSDSKVGLAYYHLIALEYAESKLEAVKVEVNQLTKQSNKDPEKYKKAYARLRYVNDRAQEIIKYHSERAMEHLEAALPEDQKKAIREKRTAENKCYERIFIEKPEIQHNVEFRPADQL